MRNIVVLIFILCGLLYSLGTRFGSVLFYWWYAIFRPQDWIYMNIEAFRFSLIIGLIVVFGCLLSGNFPRIRGTNSVLMICFLFLAVVAAATHGCLEAWKWTDYLFRLFLILFFTDRLLNSPRRVGVLLLVIALSLGFYSSKAGLQSLLGGYQQYGQTPLGGSWADSNAFALGIVVIMFFWIACAKNLSLILGDLALNSDGSEQFWVAWVRRGFYVAIALSGFNVMSLHSRGSFLAMAGGFLVYFASQRKGVRRLLLLVPLLPILYLVVPLPAGFEERIATVFVENEEDRDSSAASRPHFWAVAVLMANDVPLGTGPMCYNELYNKYDPSEGAWGVNRSVHSSHFQVLAEIGYVGVVIWLLLNVVSILQCLSVRARSRHLSLDPATARFLETTSTCLLCALLAFGFGSSFYPVAFIELPWLLFVLTGTLSHLASQAIQKATEKEASESRGLYASAR